MNTPSKALSLLGIAFAVTLGLGSLLLLVVFLYLGSFQFFAFGFGPAATLGWDANAQLSILPPTQPHGPPLFPAAPWQVRP